MKATLLFLFSFISLLQASEKEWLKYHNQIQSFAKERKFDEAIKSAKTAITIAQKSGEKHPMMGLSYSNLATVFLHMGKYKPSLAHLPLKRKRQLRERLLH